jgi:hypothetical protein
MFSAEGQVPRTAKGNLPHARAAVKRKQDLHEHSLQ